jgi:hypothetical protein
MHPHRSAIRNFSRGENAQKGRNHEDQQTTRDRRLSIALHPGTPKHQAPNDSGQVLALPPNRAISAIATISAEKTPIPFHLSPAAAGTSTQATHGLRTSTKNILSLENPAVSCQRTIASRMDTIGILFLGVALSHGCGRGD